MTFTANVVATGGADKTVAWSVTGATSPTNATTITSEGVLTVGADETADTLTVTAANVYGTRVTGSATVTVVHKS